MKFPLECFVMPAPNFTIPRDKIEVRTSRSGGAGGQHVNKVETKVELRFHLASAEWLPLAVRDRIAQAYATRINREGEFVLTTDETRSQTRNAELCYEKLAGLIESCWRAPKKRIKTKATRASKERGLTAKKMTGARKKMRGHAE